MQQTILDEVDIISGVSGGSYALAWYLIQKSEYYKGSDQELFSEILNAVNLHEVASGMMQTVQKLG